MLASTYVSLRYGPDLFYTFQEDTTCSIVIPGGLLCWITVLISDANMELNKGVVSGFLFYRFHIVCGGPNLAVDYDFKKSESTSSKVLIN